MRMAHMFSLITHVYPMYHTSVDVCRKGCVRVEVSAKRVNQVLVTDDKLDRYYGTRPFKTNHLTLLLNLLGVKNLNYVTAV